MDVLRAIANLRGSRGTLLEHSTVADSQSNGLIERGIRSVEEMTRVILFDLSSRVGSPISVHSPVFPWLGKRFHTEEHIVARKGDGLVIRSSAVKAGA